MKKLLIALIVLASVGSGGYYLAKTLKSKADSPKKVDTVTAERGDLSLNVLATGTVTPEVEVVIKSKAGGEISSFPFNEGDLLKKNEVVVKLDPKTETARVSQSEASTRAAEARLDKARISLKEASMNLEREKKLFAGGIVSKQDLDNAVVAHLKAKSDVKLNEAELAQAKEALEEARERLADTEIRAPLTGTILVKDVDVGQVISSTLSSASEGTPLFTMANLDTLYVEALVDEVDIGKVRPGQEATVSVDSMPEREFTGVVKRIAPKGQVERTITVFEVVIEIVGDKTGLRPEMTADVRINTETLTDVLLLPNETLVQMGEKTGVYTMKDGESVWKPVTTGKTDGLVTEITGGIEPGERVLKSGLPTKNAVTRKRGLFF